MSQQSIAFAKETLLGAKGFQPNFIDSSVNIRFDKPLPNELRQFLPQVEGNTDGHLHYSGLSVLYNAQRRVPFLSAYNIDGKKKATGIRRASAFRQDPRIDADIQLSKKGFYDLRTDITEFEIGHMAANDELAWGNSAQLQAYQTFHFPNSVPQAERLNTGIWKSLEGYIIREAATLKTNKRISVFTGPVINGDDPFYNREPQFQIPLLFYKVILFPTKDGIRSTAFLMSHEQRMIEQHMFVEDPLEMLESGAGVGVREFMDFGYRKVFQINLSLIEDLTGLDFQWRGVKRIKVPGDKLQVQKIRKIRDAKDANDALEGFRKSKVETSNKDLTASEIRKNEFGLTLILE